MFFIYIYFLVSPFNIKVVDDPGELRWSSFYFFHYYFFVTLFIIIVFYNHTI